MILNIQKNEISRERLMDLQIGLVYLFGSQAEGVAGPGSDIDIGIVFNNPEIVKGNTTDIYQTLYDIFSSAFDLGDFRTIDIIFLERTSLELQVDAIIHGKVLFEISPDFRLNFEERTLALFRDFKVILNQFNQTVLERIV
ncbi:nucleotidyltransferase domain-containing protein [Candidatus Azambacteria bacterium]|nr:nucleotidyltransferase domain-containing protein [Candidatus Azambacteria bacterium]